jgi:hypothetical protein
LISVVAAVLAAPVWAADDTEESRCKRVCAMKRVTASSKPRCSLTGTVVETCCCVERAGRLYCTLAKKNVDSCCCQSAAGGSSEGSRGEAAGGHPGQPLGAVCGGRLLGGPVLLN